nr:hypothetical protein [Candidatus Shapirobacteria bacterium]
LRTGAETQQYRYGNKPEELLIVAEGQICNLQSMDEDSFPGEEVERATIIVGSYKASPGTKCGVVQYSEPYFFKGQNGIAVTKSESGIELKMPSREKIGDEGKVASMDLVNPANEGLKMKPGDGPILVEYKNIRIILGDKMLEVSKDEKRRDLITLNGEKNNLVLPKAVWIEDDQLQSKSKVLGQYTDEAIAFESQGLLLIPVGDKLLVYNTPGKNSCEVSIVNTNIGLESLGNKNKVEQISLSIPKEYAEDEPAVDLFLEPLIIQVTPDETSGADRVLTTNSSATWVDGPGSGKQGIEIGSDKMAERLVEMVSKNTDVGLINAGFGALNFKEKYLWWRSAGGGAIFSLNKDGSVKPILLEKDREGGQSSSGCVDHSDMEVVVGMTDGGMDFLADSDFWKPYFKITEEELDYARKVMAGNDNHKAIEHDVEGVASRILVAIKKAWDECNHDPVVFRENMEILADRYKQKFPSGNPNMPDDSTMVILAKKHVV